MRDSSLPESLRNLVDRELAAGEVVHWTAQPSPGRFAMNSLVTALFGIPFTGFAVFWIMKGFEMNARTAKHFPGHNGALDQLFPLFGVPFVIVGLFMLSSPLWMTHKASSTVYVVTNRRAIIFEGGWSTQVRSFAPSELGQIERRDHDDGSGDLILAKNSIIRRVTIRREPIRRGTIPERQDEAGTMCPDTMCPDTLCPVDGRQ